MPLRSLTVLHRQQPVLDEIVPLEDTFATS
jgi:hypothetical protein